MGLYDEPVLDEDVNEQEAENEMAIEKRRNRGWLTNRKIRNKFTRQWNQLKNVMTRTANVDSSYNAMLIPLTADIAQIETDIDGVQAHLFQLELSYQEKCDRLDALLDPDSDCCRKGLEIQCIERAFQIKPMATTGCGACPV